MSVVTKAFLACFAIAATCSAAGAQVYVGPEGNYHTPESLSNAYRDYAPTPGYQGYSGGYTQGYRGYGYGNAQPYGYGYGYGQPYGYAQPYGYGYYGNRTTREGDYRY
jgi:hypothetical protein